MPHHDSLILILVAGFVLAFAFGMLAHRIKLSPLVGYLLAGIVVGPFTPGYVADASLAPQLAEVGVILLMFGVGLHFSPQDLMQVRKVALPGAMASLWLVGREVAPEQCAELCVFEIFGSAVSDGTAEVGSGLHAFRDPDVPEDFSTTTIELDVSDFHTYGASWSFDSVSFDVDGVVTRTCERPPTYPLQLMLAVFDFPDQGTDAERDYVPRLLVDRVSVS